MKAAWSPIRCIRSKPRMSREKARERSMSETFRWTCPMSTRGSRLMVPTIAGPTVPPAFVGAGAFGTAPAPEDLPFYGPHGVEPLNAASAKTPSASSRDLILVIQNTSFREEPGHRNARGLKRGSLLLSSGDAGLTMSSWVIKMNRVPEGLVGAEETIGQRLRRLRLERGLSQRERSGPGVSYANISRIAGGGRPPFG